MVLQCLVIQLTVMCSFITSEYTLPESAKSRSFYDKLSSSSLDINNAETQQNRNYTCCTIRRPSWVVYRKYLQALQKIKQYQERLDAEYYYDDDYNEYPEYSEGIQINDKSANGGRPDNASITNVTDVGMQMVVDIIQGIVNFVNLNNSMVGAVMGNSTLLQSLLGAGIRNNTAINSMLGVLNNPMMTAAMLNRTLMDVLVNSGRMNNNFISTLMDTGISKTAMGGVNLLNDTLVDVMTVLSNNTLLNSLVCLVNSSVKNSGLPINADLIANNPTLNTIMNV